MPIVFTLADTINAESITKYRLSKESGVRPNTVADIYNGEARSLSVEALDALMGALNRLSDKTHGLESILKYVDHETP